MNEPYVEGIAWIVRGARTKKAIITAPDRSSGTDEAATRLDRALDGFAGPVPPWYDFMHRPESMLVYVLVSAIGATSAVLLTPLEAGPAIFLGLIAGGVAAAILVKAADVLAHRRAGGKARPEDVIREVAPLARPAHYVVDLAETLVVLDPATEAETHRLAWQAASPEEAESRSAEAELLRRLAVLDPVEAADYEELLKAPRDR
ncbi:hypothetical protein [Glycomyces algeriensis]|uniref:Uncharacterized protein n=1 Tax=Glycomyces algeriensis TaxID=256037 RepID=A0A9W6G7K1_9ACTN|nr:hypothetical protein [Glycomyces algeriensis]MDA1364999.1 hypothetical protein [Glycomyces algeriensis]MDR7349940.1 hypothetical protein [Glycomyces algeriensis]GLI42650.1 hypothetical protein GALLR39Z86_25000 [Glycomyces algeriensis]